MSPTYAIKNYKFAVVIFLFSNEAVSIFQLNNFDVFEKDVGQLYSI